MRGHIGESSDDLLFRRQLGAFLEFKVANRPRQSEVAIDTAKVHESSSGADARFLA
jgi:hypothetical protein